VTHVQAASASAIERAITCWPLQSHFFATGKNVIGEKTILKWPTTTRYWRIGCWVQRLASVLIKDEWKSLFGGITLRYLKSSNPCYWKPYSSSSLLREDW